MLECVREGGSDWLDMYKQTESWNVSGRVGVTGWICTSRLNAGMCQGGWE